MGHPRTAASVHGFPHERHAGHAAGDVPAAQPTRDHHADAVRHVQPGAFQKALKCGIPARLHHKLRVNRGDVRTYPALRPGIDPRRGVAQVDAVNPRAEDAKLDGAQRLGLSGG